MSKSKGSRYDDAPWRDRDRLWELYVEEDLSSPKVADRLGCSERTVIKWCREFGIPIRDSTDKLPAGLPAGREHPNWKEHMPFRIHPNGYEVWSDHKRTFGVHRLAAVAWWGIEAVKGKEVHHKNEIPWDNREENLELLTPSEHSKHHAQIQWAESREGSDE